MNGISTCGKRGLSPISSRWQKKWLLMCFSGRLRDKNENDGQLFRGMDSRDKTGVYRFYGAHRKASLAPFRAFRAVENVVCPRFLHSRRDRVPILAAEVREAINCAVTMPLAWMQIDEGVRRVLVHRFPFAVLYSEGDEGLFILAVMHLRREPNYWTHRTADTEGDGK